LQARTISTDLSVVERIDGGATTSYINSINSLVVIGEFAYIATGSPDYNLLRVNLTNADITDAPTPRPTAMPTLAASPAPTPGGPPPPPPGVRRLSESAASSAGGVDGGSEAMQRLVVDTLTNALVQAAGLEGTDTAAALQELLERSATHAAKRSSEGVRVAHTAGPNHHARRLAASSNLPTDNLGVYQGAHVHRVNDSFIYFQDGNETYFDPSTQEFGVYTDYPDSYYLATAVQLAYNFAICDGVVVSNWTIATGSSSAFYEACDDINGYAVLCM
jgi:hypothetical protein